MEVHLVVTMLDIVKSTAPMVFFANKLINFIFWQVEDLDLLVEHVDATNYKRACLYLTSSSK